MLERSNARLNHVFSIRDVCMFTRRPLTVPLGRVEAKVWEGTEGAGQRNVAEYRPGSIQY